MTDSETGKDQVVYYIFYHLGKLSAITLKTNSYSTVYSTVEKPAHKEKKIEFAVNLTCCYKTCPLKKNQVMKAIKKQLSLLSEVTASYTTEREKRRAFSYSLHMQASGYQKKQSQHHGALVPNTSPTDPRCKFPTPHTGRPCMRENDERERDEFPHSSEPQKCTVVDVSLQKNVSSIYFL